MAEFPYTICVWGFRHQPGWAKVSDPCTDESPFGSKCPSAETQGLLQLHLVAPVAGSCGQGCLPAPAHLLFLHISRGCAVFSLSQRRDLPLLCFGKAASCGAGSRRGGTWSGLAADICQG